MKTNTFPSPWKLMVLRCNVLLKWSHFRWHWLMFCVVLRRSTFHHGFSQALQDASGCCDEIIHIHTHLEPIVVFGGFKGIKETVMKCLVGGNLGWCFEASRWELFFFGHLSVGIIFSLTKALICLVQHPRKRLGNIYCIYLHNISFHLCDIYLHIGLNVNP